MTPFHIDSQGELEEWNKHLLDQGTSIFKNRATRVSQSVDLNWCMSSGDAEDIMNNMVAPKLFPGKIILCYGQEFVKADNTKGKGVARASQG